MRQTEPDQTFFFGVDSEGIRTDVTVVDSSGRYIDQYYGAPSNPGRIPKERAVNNIVSALAQAASVLLGRDLDSITVGGIVVGLPEVGHEADRCAVLLNNDPHLFDIPMWVTTVTEIAIGGFSDRTVVQISDVSAATFARNGLGRVYRTGEYGFGGNPGSSISLMSQGFNLAQNEAKDEGLSHRLMTHFRLKTLSDFPINLEYLSRDFMKYRKTVDEFVGVMAAEAYSGNASCSRIFVEVANSLYNSTRQSIEELDMRTETITLGLVGNTWRAGDLLVRPYLDQVKLYAPYLVVKKDANTPAHSAALMGLEKYG